DEPADEVERAVPNERAGKKPGLAQDLEAVADAEDRAAALSELADGTEHRREPRDRPRPQVVAVGEPSGEDDRVDVAELRVAVPGRNAGAAHALHGSERVTVVVRSGERDDSDPGS